MAYTGWIRLILAIAVGSTCALILAWIAAPVLASKLVIFQGDKDSQSVTNGLLAYDMLFSFMAFFAGSFVSYLIAKVKPYWACCAVGFVGWVVYLIEAGGLPGMLSGQYPLWYEFAPTHLFSSLLAAWLVSRRRRAV